MPHRAQEIPVVPPARIAFVCEGDASQSETAFSGTAKRLFYALRERGYDVFPVDASLSGWRRALAAARSVSPDRLQWRSRFRYGASTSHLRAAAARQSLGSQTADLVFQIGATYEPPLAGKVPYALFADWSMALDAQEAREAGETRNGLSAAELEGLDRTHVPLYRGAAAVFTISGRLRESFLDLYRLPPDRVHTAYAGPNFAEGVIESARALPQGSPVPTVLFIAKEFERKGGDTVARALPLIQERLPDARLLFAGAPAIPPALAGLRNVEHLGILDKGNPAELDRLLRAFREADVLVLPSLRDPFPTVIREAMFLELPAVASNIWAMPEMIADGQTGFLVPPRDPEALASRCLALLLHPERRQQFGEAALLRAEERFSWPAVGEALDRGIQHALNLR